MADTLATLWKEERKAEFYDVLVSERLDREWEWEAFIRNGEPFLNDLCHHSEGGSKGVNFLWQHTSTLTQHLEWLLEEPTRALEAEKGYLEQKRKNTHNACKSARNQRFKRRLD